ncbi:MAG TPA: Ig-like domain-containing protein [Brevibacillus sp.]|nr:Ig-like domain-containing protein [Brevibacillus sp.]
MNPELDTYLEVTFNSPPTDIQLSNHTVPENSLAGTEIGLLTATDPEPDETFTFTLSGTDAEAFFVQENQLLTQRPLDYETKSLYTFLIHVTNSSGGTFSKSFTIQVLDVNEPPVIESFLINDGAESTSSQKVTIKTLITDPDAGDSVQMRLSDVENEWNSAWVPYTPEYEWNLSAGEGLKTVYVQAKDSEGLESHVVSRTIYLDQTPLVVEGIVNGGVYNHDVTITFNKGTARLNGVDFHSGTTVSEEKNPHQLTVTEPSGKETTYRFTIDKSAPVAHVQINGGAAFTNLTTVELSLAVTDLTNVKMSFSNDGVSWSALDPFTGTKQWVIGSGEGKKTVYVKMVDELGHETIETASIILDTTKPTGRIESIDGGKTFTNQTTVDLDITFADENGQVEMSLSNDNLTWSAWEAAQTKKAITLPSGDGEKKVYLKLRDQAGNVTDAGSSQIILDTTAPIVSLLINGRDPFTSSREVTLNFTALDIGFPLVYRYSNEDSEWTQWGPERNVWQLTAGDGLKTVTMEARDQAGNIGRTSSSITLSMEAPVVTGVTDGGKYNHDVLISFNKGTATLNGLPFANNTLFSQEGDFMLIVIDEARRVTRILFTIDKTKPTGNVVINNGAAYTTSRNVFLNVTAYENRSGLAFRAANEDLVWTDWSYLSPTAWQLTDGDGLKTVTIEARDAAGNVAVFTSSITLNTVSPAVVGVVDGASYNSDVTISFNKGTATLNGVPFANNTTVTAEGTYHLIVTDTAGLVTIVNFTVDKTPPSGSFTINNGAATTSSARVNLSVAATDHLSRIEMRIANENSTWSNWQAYSRTVSWTLPNGNGPKKVLLELRDEAGNVTSLEKSIVLRVSNPPPWVPVTGISLDEDRFTLLEGEGRTLIATISPSHASNKAVIWSSSDPHVAEVNGSGVVTAKKPGDAVITATTVEGQKTASAKVTVKKAVEEVPVTGVKLDRDSLKLLVGENHKLKATLQPNDATNQAVIWSSSHPKVASVDEEGVVTAHKAGEATITVTTADGGKTDTAAITVRKKNDRQGTLAASDSALWLSPRITASVSIYYREDGIRTKINQDPKTRFHSENGLVTFENGRIKTGKEEGEDWITVSYQGEELVIPVTISRQSIRSLTIDAGRNVILEAGGEKQLRLYGTTKNGDDPELTDLASWTSSDPDVARVTDEGEIIAGEPGKATITARYSGKSITVRVLVMEEKEIREIRLSPLFLNMEEGESRQLRLYAEYEKGYDEIVSDDWDWEIEDTSIATVKDGKVKALQTGETILTVRYEGYETQVRIVVR